MTTERISVLLVDDHALVRRGLRRLLDDDAGIAVVDEAGDGAAAMRLLRSETPRVVVLDFAMPGSNGLALIRRMLEAQPDVAILVLSIHGDEGLVRGVLAAGAKGYLLKDSHGSQLAEAIRRVAAGEIMLDASMAPDAILGGPSLHALSTRQLEVLQLLCEGLTNDGIAVRLGVSPNTVAVHRAGIMKRLGTHSLTQLVGYAIRHRLVVVP